MLAALLAGCASLPSQQGRTASTALSDTSQTRLGRNAAALAAAHPGKSGVHAFPNPLDAFSVRVKLAEVAEKSIDAQYFIWNGDEVGTLLFEALWQAAERGVRVRLLLDDANTSGLDATLAVLDAHPNVEIRLYNPFSYRGSRAVGYVTDFQRLNRRMHNKSFTVDNQLSVVGGRNIANEYFGAGTGIGFADIDVLTVGPVVPEVSKEFDLFWNSPSAYPAAAFVGAPAADGVAVLQRNFEETRTDPVAVAYLKAIADGGHLARLANRQLEIEWIDAEVVHDDPAKTLDTTNRTDVLLLTDVMAKLGRPTRTMDIISPYFVPGDDGTAGLVAMAALGVKVRVLTNSLASSDESVVHAGYMKRRHELLRAGIKLYEVKPTATDETALKVKGNFGSAKVAGLHGKVYASDRARIFVGSFNFDQRSARLNTEMGLVLHSPLLASQVATNFDTVMPLAAYEVRLQADGERLVWIERSASGEERRYDVEPETDAFKRWWVDALSTLPIDWLL